MWDHAGRSCHEGPIARTTNIHISNMQTVAVRKLLLHSLGHRKAGSHGRFEPAVPSRHACSNTDKSGIPAKGGVSDETRTTVAASATHKGSATGSRAGGQPTGAGHTTGCLCPCVRSRIPTAICSSTYKPRTHSETYFVLALVSDCQH